MGPLTFPMWTCPQQSEEDVSQFDTRFTRQTPVDSPDDTALSESADQAFLVRSWGTWGPGLTGTVAEWGPECHLAWSLPPQGFTYVAPSVLDSIKEGFSFQPKLRSPRRLNSSPRTPIRYEGQGEEQGALADRRW